MTFAQNAGERSPLTYEQRVAASVAGTDGILHRAFVLRRMPRLRALLEQMPWSIPDWQYDDGYEPCAIGTHACAI
jgi:hypothetical protein